MISFTFFFFFSSRRRHTRYWRDWSSDVCSSDLIEAMTNYRAHFKPSGWRGTPHGILAVAAVAAETDAEAEHLASSMDLNRLRRDRGQYLPLSSVEEALAYPYTDSERASIARNRSRLFVGSPATVMQKLQPMIKIGRAHV